jgi:dTDP-4-amino-4,6-dideoxygalactose transaminase
VKAALDALAVFGGRPAFDEDRHVGRPNVLGRERFLARVEDMLDRRWLTNDGPYVRQLEEGFERALAVGHCVAVSNATLALGLLARALGLTGDVIVPAFTFVATAHAFAWHGLSPVFADVDPANHGLDPHHAESLITPRTTAIVGVHLWGRPCAVDELSALAHRHGLALLFDASHALAASYRGRMVGNFGQAEVFSLHATKFAHSFEGGLIATNDDDLAARLRRVRNFGFDGYDSVAELGINGKMSEVQAAMGLASLELLDELIERNRESYDRYRARLRRLPGLRLVEYDSRQRNNYQYLVLEVDAEVAGISRDAIQRVLWAERVLARRYFHPGCHRIEPYRSWPRYRGLHLTVTQRLAEEVLCLPTGTAVCEADIDEICDLIELCTAYGPELSSRLDQLAPLTQTIS